MGERSMKLACSALFVVLCASVAYAEHPMWSMSPRELPVGTTYGGNYPWVGKAYKMEATGWSPLSLTEEATIHALNWTYIAMREDGNFFRPGQTDPIFPDAGTVLAWRFNGTDDNGRDKLVIDFCSDVNCASGEPWGWRYDAGVANEDYSVWTFTGHVSITSFPWTLTEVSLDEAGLVPAETKAAHHEVWDMPSREIPVGTAYGGNYPWVGVGYKMEATGWSPLSLTEEATIHALNWTYIAMREDGNFFRPGQT